MPVPLLQSRVLRVSLFVIAAALAVVAIYFIFTRSTRAAPGQPIEFSHRIMVSAGITCMFCHPDAARSPMAGMPSVSKCMGCHKIITTQNPRIKILAGYWERQEPVPWIRVNRLPRFVYFTHRAHIANGLNCETCHGDVGDMEITVPVVAMNMSWCLSCHAQQVNAAQLRDCLVCHQ
jgi:hypothetical protein